MFTLLRSFTTDGPRLDHYRLVSGEEYFIEVARPVIGTAARPAVTTGAAATGAAATGANASVSTGAKTTGTVSETSPLGPVPATTRTSSGTGKTSTLQAATPPSRARNGPAKNATRGATTGIAERMAALSLPDPVADPEAGSATPVAVIDTVRSTSVRFIPYSTLIQYDGFPTPLVFLTEGGVTVMKDTIDTHLLREALADDELPAYPVPIVAVHDAEAIRDYSQLIRAITVQQRELALDSIHASATALHRTVDEMVRCSEHALRVADTNLSFLLENIRASTGLPQYAEVHEESLEQMQQKLEDYNALLQAIDAATSQRKRFEQAVLELQRKVVTICQVSQELDIVT